MADRNLNDSDCFSIGQNTSATDSKRGSIKPSKVLQRSQALKDFISAYDEFSSEEKLHKYYLSLDEDSESPSNKAVYDFWRDVMANYQATVSKSFSFNKAQLVKDLTLFDRIPVALDKVIE